MLKTRVTIFLVPGTAATGARATPTAGTPQAADDPAAPHAAHLHKGTCDVTTHEHYALPDAAVPAGQSEGAAASPVLSSVTAAERRSLATGIDELLGDPWMVGVHYPRYQRLIAQGLALEETYVACGEIGGVRLGDGSLAVALRERNGSGYGGVAHFAPHPDDPSRTNVEIFLARSEPTVAADGTPAP